MQLKFIRIISTDIIVKEVCLLNLGQSLAGTLSPGELILNTTPL
jgi:hypothetical protein